MMYMANGTIPPTLRATVMYMVITHHMADKAMKPVLCAGMLQNTAHL
jgi:hypothetical protein